MESWRSQSPADSLHSASEWPLTCKGVEMNFGRQSLKIKILKDTSLLSQQCSTIKEILNYCSGEAVFLKAEWRLDINSKKNLNVTFAYIMILLGLSWCDVQALLRLHIAQQKRKGEKKIHYSSITVNIISVRLHIVIVFSELELCFCSSAQTVACRATKNTAEIFRSRNTIWIKLWQ